MKRIIDGATYNTETATLMADGTWEDEQRGVTTITKLYQNRAGVFFAVVQTETGYRDRHEEWQTRNSYDWSVFDDAAEARECAEREALNIYRDIDDMPPEAEAGEKTATLYVRLPPALKAAIDEQAKAEKVSTNVMALRCLERCLGQAKAERKRQADRDAKYYREEQWALDNEEIIAAFEAGREARKEDTPAVPQFESDAETKAWRAGLRDDYDDNSYLDDLMEAAPPAQGG